MRRLFLIPAILGLVSSAAQSITREDVMARAQNWVDRGIEYSQSLYTDGYRQDCSGFVSFCWATTGGGGSPISYTTQTIAGVCTQIGKDDLQPGDALLNPGAGHVLLFQSWTDDQHTHYWAYDMANPDLDLKHWIIPYAYWSGYDPGGYRPYRYNGITVVDPCAGLDLNNLYVQFGAGSNDCGTAANPLNSLQTAITKVNGGGTINIGNSGSAGGTLNPNGKTVTLKPTGGAITLSP